MLAEKKDIRIHSLKRNPFKSINTLLNQMEYELTENFPFDMEPDGIPFGFKAQEKISSLHHNHSIRKETEICFFEFTHVMQSSGKKWKQFQQRNLFEILLNQTEIRLYLPYTD